MLSVPQLCSQLAANGEGRCSPPARRAKDSEGKGGGQVACLAWDCPLQLLSAFLSPRQTSPPVSDTSLRCQRFSERCFPALQSLTETFRTSRCSLRLPPMPHTPLAAALSPCRAKPFSPFFFFPGKYTRFFLFQPPAPATLNPKPN